MNTEGATSFRKFSKKLCKYWDCFRHWRAAELFTDILVAKMGGVW